MTDVGNMPKNALIIMNLSSIIRTHNPILLRHYVKHTFYLLPGTRYHQKYLL